jgi:hypothetical protein
MSSVMNIFFFASQEHINYINNYVNTLIATANVYGSLIKCQKNSYNISTAEILTMGLSTLTISFGSVETEGQKGKVIYSKNPEL